jgi:hypothetical protein
MKTTYSVEILGTAPLLMNSFPIPAIKGIDKKPVSEQLEIACYRVPDELSGAGKLCIPSRCIRKSIVNGGKWVKGKRTASLKNTLSPMVRVSPAYCILNHQEYTGNCESVRNPTTGSRILKYRPEIADGWSVSFDLSWDVEFVSLQQMKEVLKQSGDKAGLLDWRPQCDGMYGTYEVKSFKAKKGSVK